MASQTPSSANIPTASELKDEPYVHGWAAMTEMMNKGSSWSGRERNCCFLNLGDASFADASAISGLDFLDDGRCLAITDWDGDGDLDIWLKNRTGPQLRLMRNDLPPGQHFLSLKLIGQTCNRDAIGARVTLRIRDKALTRSVVAGDGYLAQSSKRVHFGLGSSDRIDSISVRWPGGDSQEFPGVAVDSEYELRQGADDLVKINRPRLKLADSPTEKQAPTDQASIVLRTPLPLPPSILADLGGQQNNRAKLINLWAQWCPPCIQELSDFATNYGELHAAGLDILAINVDPPADREKAEKLFAEQVAAKMRDVKFVEKVMPGDMLETFDAVRQHVVGKESDLSLPCSFLLDKTGVLQVLYLGPVGTKQLLKDLDRYITRPMPAHRKSAAAGRWYYRAPRDLNSLIVDLKSRGREDDAHHYLANERLKNQKRQN